MLCISEAYAVARCLSICLSVRPKCHVRVFCTGRCGNVRTGGPKGGFDLDQYLATSRVVNAATAKYYIHSCTGPWQVGDTHIAGSNKRRRLLFTGDGRRSVYDKKS